MSINNITKPTESFNEKLELLSEQHKLLTVIQNLEVGIIVLDKTFKVSLWNSFMEINSGFSSDKIIGHNLFEIFPEISSSWLREKILEAFSLESTVFDIWRQHKEIFHFPNSRPFTGQMYEKKLNFTITPIKGLNGQTNEVLISIYDVTDEVCSEINLEKANHRLLESSITDGLTGLYNRKHWENCLRDAYSLYKRNREPISLLMFDIDHFKLVNDTYGHQAGDAVLQRLSKVVNKQIRSTDTAGRYGGEEFTIILRGAGYIAGYFVAERLRHAIEEETIEYNNPEKGIQIIKFNISIGICELNIGSMPVYTDWLKKTDQALYFSKEHGRNRSTIYSITDNIKHMNDVIPHPKALYTTH